MTAPVQAPRRRIRARIALAALLALGPAVFAGQTTWARHIAAVSVREEIEAGRDPRTGDLDCNEVCARALVKWRTVPWYGVHDAQFLWVPRRAYHELFLRMTGADLPDGPEAWAAWLELHPDLVWNEDLKRLADRGSR